LTEPPEATPYPYAYPPSPHSRKHGPSGYTDYESYRDWLRDEFSFRCVYCLYREQWGVQISRWHIDHLSPQALNPALGLTYDNLLYACSSCNTTKGARLVPDPCAMDLASSLEVDIDGVIKAKNKEGQLLIKIMRLDNEDYTRFRAMIIKTMQILANADRDTYLLWMGYPEELPDLSKLRPSSNTRPDGIKNSFFARHQRGELDEVY